jgi:hypothetical protein
VRKAEAIAKQYAREAEALAKEKAREKALAEASYQQQAQEQKRLALRTSNEAGKADAQARYHTCLSSVENDYSVSWAAACKRAEAQSWSERNDCIARAVGLDFCARITIDDGSPDCALPISIASELESILEKHRDRCLQEVNAGLR